MGEGRWISTENNPEMPPKQNTNTLMEIQMRLTADIYNN
jgi:hypothetical protein